MLSTPRSPPASTAFRFAFDQTAAHRRASQSPSPIQYSFREANIPSPLLSPSLYSSHFEIPPTPPLRVPKPRLTMPRDSPRVTKQQQMSYFPVQAAQSSPLQSCLRTKNPDPNSNLDSPRVGKVKKWGQSIDIDPKPYVIAELDFQEGAASTSNQGSKMILNENPMFKKVAGRVSTPYHENISWLEHCACGSWNQGQKCLKHELSNPL